MCSLRNEARSSSFNFEIVVPFMDTLPEVGVSSPAHKPNRVVFPLPDGPMMAAVEPLSMWKLTSDRTVSSPVPDQ